MTLNCRRRNSPLAHTCNLGSFNRKPGEVNQGNYEFKAIWGYSGKIPISKIKNKTEQKEKRKEEKEGRKEGRKNFVLAVTACLPSERLDTFQVKTQ